MPIAINPSFNLQDFAFEIGAALNPSMEFSILIHGKNDGFEISVNIISLAIIISLLNYDKYVRSNSSEML